MNRPTFELNDEPAAATADDSKSNSNSYDPGAGKLRLDSLTKLFRRPEVENGANPGNLATITRGSVYAPGPGTMLTASNGPLRGAFDKSAETMKWDVVCERKERERIYEKRDSIDL